MWLDLLLIQGVLGGFDTAYHHEVTEKLAYRAGAEKELAIHGVRSLLYAVVFGGLAWAEWRGLFAIAMAGIFAVEIGLTLWDFVVEDRTRTLPASERVTHAVLAINGGVFLALLVPELAGWVREATALEAIDYGWRSVGLSILAAGLVASGLRDLHARSVLMRVPRATPGADFGAARLSVLVTGGTGFIGQRLVWTLLDNGHEVTLLARNKARAWTLFGGRVSAVDDLAALQPTHAFDVVINLAGEPVVGLPWTVSRRRRLIASRVMTTQALVRWIRLARQRPCVLVNASAIGFYGNRGDEPLGEDASSQDVFTSRLCGEWERAAREAGRYGVRVCVMRLGLVLGWGGALPLLIAPHLLALGARLGSGTQWVSWVHVDDVVRACAFLVRHEHASGVYNVTAPEPLPQGEFADAIARWLGHRVWLRIPAGVLHFVAGEMADMFTRGQRVLPQRLGALGFRFRVTRVEDALRRLTGTTR